MTEPDRLVEYLSMLNLYEYVGFHNDGNVVVLTDSGYDKIQNTVLGRGWHFVGALKCSRSIKSEAGYAKTPKSSGWDGIAVFFKKYRKFAWTTVRILTDGPKKKAEGVPHTTYRGFSQRCGENKSGMPGI